MKKYNIFTPPRASDILRLQCLQLHAQHLGCPVYWNIKKNRKELYENDSSSTKYWQKRIHVRSIVVNFYQTYLTFMITFGSIALIESSWNRSLLLSTTGGWTSNLYCPMTLICCKVGLELLSYACILRNKCNYVQRNDKILIPWQLWQPVWELCHHLWLI